MRRRGWIGRSRRVVEHRQEPLAAPVRDLEQQHAVAPRRVGRPEHVEVGFETDPPVGAARRVGQIDDWLVVWIGRVERELDAPNQLFVGPGGAEGLAVSHG
jgi:hypothetical protein